MMEGCSCIRSLRNMEVINLCDGKRCGFVTDVSVDTACGRIAALCVLVDDGKCLSLGKPEHMMIPWDVVERIGADVILVNMPPRCNPCGDTKHKR